MWGVKPEDEVFQVAKDDRQSESKRKGGRIVGWSDKGTVHVWGDESDGSLPP